MKILRKSLIVVAGLAVLATGLLAVALRRERSSTLELPRPTGGYAVGRAIHDWTWRESGDPAAADRGEERELLVWIWYPAVGVRLSPTYDYLPAQLRSGAQYSRGPLGLITRDLSQVRGHSADEPELAPDKALYPVVIMRAGASAPVLSYSTLAEDLASQGYVVVAFDAPYRTQAVVFPDGRVVLRSAENEIDAGPEEEQIRRAERLLAAWTGDIARVLDRLSTLTPKETAGRLAGRLDLDRVGVFGHSFGGAAAAQFCHEDARCKAGIDLDGQLFGRVVEEGLKQPFMFLLSDHQREPDTERRLIMGRIRSVYERLPPDGRQLVAIRGGQHFLFSDDGALLKSQLVQRGLRRFGLLGIDGRRQLEVTAYCIRSFFDAHLEETSHRPLTLSSPLYPEIQSLE